MKLFLLLLAVAVACTAAAAFQCQSEMDCELLGECVSGVCKCQPGWTGPTCGQLRLLPAPFQGAWPKNRPIPPTANTPPVTSDKNNNASALLPNSWGASIVHKDNKYHMFVDTGCFDQKTLLHEWGYQLSHGVSDDITGPYTFVDTAVGPTSFNPHLSVTPDGMYVLYHLYQEENPMTIPRCFGNETSPTDRVISSGDVPVKSSTSRHNPARENGNTDPWKVKIAYSTSLSGPWSEKQIDIVGDSGDMMNPQAYIHPNGSVLLVYTSLDSKTYSTINFASSKGWNDTYVHVGKVVGMPMPNVSAEDPYLWRNGDGSYHMILHMYQWYGPWSALHAYSADGISWNVSPHVDGEGCYNTTVSWDDGTSTHFYRRERPELLFDDEGKMTHLLTSLEYGTDHPDHQYSFTLIQKIDRDE